MPLLLNHTRQIHALRPQVAASQLQKVIYPPSFTVTATDLTLGFTQFMADFIIRKD